MIQQPDELNEVLQRVEHWPPALRIHVARRLLESVDVRDSQSPRRGWSAAEAMTTVNSRQPAPDDATVKQWIDEHRWEKYGQ